MKQPLYYSVTTEQMSKIYDFSGGMFRHTCLIQVLKVQMNCFFIPEFERAAKIRKIAVYRFLISFLVPEL